MEEYPSNAHSVKEKSSLDAPIENPPQKKIDKAVSGEVKKRKKQGLKEITNGFIQAEVDDVSGHVWTDVLRPAIKKTLFDMITKAIDMFLFSEDETPRRTQRDRASWQQNYNSSGAPKRDIERVKNNYDFDDILCREKQDAKNILDTLSAALELYGNVSVADLYSAAGKSGEYTDNNYGWTDISGAKLLLTEDGWLLKMPKAKPLK